MEATASSSTCVGAELIDELLRLACDDDRRAAVVSHALEACSALACTCSSERVTGVINFCDEFAGHSAYGRAGIQ